MTNGSAVSAELGLRLVVPGGTATPLTAGLYYSPADPYAVQVSFNVGKDEPVEWTFGRELLAMGVAGPAGLGDVKAWPSPDSVTGLRGLVLNVELSSPYGEAHFEVSAREVSDFLRCTYRVVPQGRESEWIDIEDQLTDLLREAL
jgi:hypothetical protein